MVTCGRENAVYRGNGPQTQRLWRAQLLVTRKWAKPCRRCSLGVVLVGLRNILLCHLGKRRIHLDIVTRCACARSNCAMCPGRLGMFLGPREHGLLSLGQIQTGHNAVPDCDALVGPHGALLLVFEWRIQNFPVLAGGGWFLMRRLL